LSIRAFSLILAAIVAAALVAGGCGGSDSLGSSGEITVETGSLTKAEFIKRADAMCRDTRIQAMRKFRALAEDLQSVRPPAASEKIVDTVLVPVYEELIDQVSALGAPKGDEQEVAGFLNTLQRNLDLAEKEPAKALGSPFKGAAEQAEKYGLIGCAGSLT
jgi:hypothetical protein